MLYCHRPRAVQMNTATGVPLRLRRAFARTLEPDTGNTGVGSWINDALCLRICPETFLIDSEEFLP